MKILLFTFVLFLLISVTNLIAQNGIPQTMSYQGLLTKKIGNASVPVTDGNYIMAFSIWDQVSGGSELWTTVSPHITCKVKNGSFSVILGNTIPPLLTTPEITLPFNEQYWLQIVVIGGPDPSVSQFPRIQLSTSPYAFSAQRLIGLQCSTNGLNSTAGGLTNTAAGPYSTISGGELNTIAEATTHAMIGGGRQNQILIGLGTIAGGSENSISGNLSFIGAGEKNQISSGSSVIAGGEDNVISSELGFIGGGNTNRILAGTASGASVITGGWENTITDGQFSLIGSGTGNTVSSTSSAISGGSGNIIANESDISIIGGGETNRIKSMSGAIVGGTNNEIDLNAHHSFIGGGSTNHVLGLYSTIGGGNANEINVSGSVGSSTVGGGLSNRIYGEYGVISGGQTNTIEATAVNGTIGGGEDNSVTGYIGTISGGQGNIAEGEYSTIGGGEGNSATGNFSTIPGGSSNSATGEKSLAAGFRAKANHTGTFVWADHTDADFSSNGVDQFLIRASGGTGIMTPNPQAEFHIGQITNPNNSITAPGPSFVNGVTPTLEGLYLQAYVGGDFRRYSDIASVGYFNNAEGGSILRFLTNDKNSSEVAERMRIERNGFIGIGTSSPAHLLHLYNPEKTIATSTQMKIETDDNDGDAELLIDRGFDHRAAQIQFQTDNSTLWYMGILRNGGSTTNRFALSTQSDLNVHTAELVVKTDKVGIKSIDPHSTLHVNGSIATGVVTTSSNVTLDATHHIVICQPATSATQVVTLPAASSVSGREYIIKSATNDATAQVSIHSNGGNIDGDPVTSITEWQTITLVSNGTDWFIVNVY